MQTPQSIRRVSSVPVLVSPVTPTPVPRPSLLPRKASSPRMTIKVVEPARCALPIAVGTENVDSPPLSAPLSHFSPDSIAATDPFDAVEPIQLPSTLRHEVRGAYSDVAD